MNSFNTQLHSDETVPCTDEERQIINEQQMIDIDDECEIVEYVPVDEMKVLELDQVVADKISNLGDDAETSHLSADGMLCDILRHLGFNKTVDEFEQLSKWYA